MNPTFSPTQIGYTPTGSAYGSQVIIGRNMLGTNWEAIGYGQAGRPDYVERVYVNLTLASGVAPAQKATLSFNVSDIQTIIQGSANANAAALTFQLREFDVCDSSTAKKVMILASVPYVR